jgi:hypothetical protein
MTIHLVSSAQKDPESPLTPPEDPDRYDPLTSPDDERPEGWDAPDRDMPEADEPSPLSDDRR